MNIRPFDLERIQSVYENTVEYNLTESGFHPFTLSSLLTPEQIEGINNTVLGYGQTNGSHLLRKKISDIYDGMTEDNVMVTNGSSEANYVACHTLLKARDEVAIMIPNYMQIWGVVEEMGCIPKAYSLREDKNWAVDLDQLESIVNENTRMIAVCNPNNPTGYTLSHEEMEAIVAVARKADAWIYVDEIYKGAELDGNEIESFIGKYEKVMVAGGFSKAYALPGLRLGWLVGPEEAIYNTWSYHDYTSITAGILSHKVGEIVLEPEKRQEIFSRNRNMLNHNLKTLEEWVAQFPEIFKLTVPKAGGLAFIKYNLPIGSTDLSDWLRIEKSVFIVAGDCFGMDGYIRIGIGSEPEYLEAGLAILGSAIKERFGC